MNYSFRQATINDKKAILDLYNSVKGREFCYWVDYYPSELEVDADIKNNLFVLEIEGKIVGAASISSENEFDNYDFWQVKEDTCELSRVCISPEYQGQHFSELIVSRLEQIISERRYKSIHLVVVKGNIPAVKCYQKLNYTFVGECSEFGNDYYACEKSFI